MSNFSKEELYEVYRKHRIIFTKLAAIAKSNGITLELTTDSDGTVNFVSREYFKENEKDCVRTHHIRHGNHVVADGSETYILKEKSNE